MLLTPIRFVADTGYVACMLLVQVTTLHDVVVWWNLYTLERNRNQCRYVATFFAKFLLHRFRNDAMFVTGMLCERYMYNSSTSQGRRVYQYSSITNAVKYVLRCEYVHVLNKYFSTDSTYLSYRIRC